jgi:glycosyltransferase involved in cell wall biosynthesis
VVPEVGVSPRPGNPDRIHVVQVIGTMHIGGAENAVVHIAQGLDRSRFDVTLVCTRERGVLAEQLASSGVEVRLAAPPSRRQRYFTPYYLQRELRRIGADVVHTHGTPSLLHVGPLAMLRTAPAWVHTYHFGNYPLPSKRLMAGERVFSRFATALVAVADVQRESIVQHHRLDGIQTIVNGVHANPFLADPSVRAAKRAEIGVQPDEILVGGIAVLTRQKGVTFLLQAAPQILQAHPKVKILVAGGGPLVEPLRAEATALGIADRVIFTGWRQDNLALLTALDVFVMASLWEAMPLALLEAMAARRPIVVTDVGDNRRVVDDGRCAAIVPPGDPAALAATVNRLLADPAAADAMAARAQARFTSAFTVARMVQEYEALYTRIAGKGPAR